MAEAPRRKSTRKDVAERAGVSVAVVTYTLNGGPVASATAEKVLKAVAELGYQPNRTAQALKSGSAHTLALIVPDDTNPFFTELAHAVELTARKRGYALYIAPSPTDRPVTAERLTDFASRQVDGVLIVPGDVPLDVSDLRNVGIPWSLIAASSSIPGITSFGVDLYGGAVAATEHLIADHGYRRLGFIGDTSGGTEPRHLGWLTSCRAHGLDPGPALHAPFTREGGHAAGLELTRSASLPEALFVASDMIGVGVLRALHQHGVNVPEDIAMVSFDGCWESEYSWPALTSIRQPVEDMAEVAVASLLTATTEQGHHQTLPGELVLRESCGSHAEPL